MQVFSEKGLADYLNISPWTIRSWRLKGGLPHFRVSRKIFYRLEAVLEWMKSEEDRHHNSGERYEKIL